MQCKQSMMIEVRVNTWSKQEKDLQSGITESRRSCSETSSYELDCINKGVRIDIRCASTFLAKQ